jgi:hypothetical protein
MHVEPDHLAFAQSIFFASENLLLVEKDVLALPGGDETILLARVEPLDLALFFGKWTCLQETAYALHWGLHIYPSLGQKVTMGGGHRKTSSTSLAHDGVY